MKYPYAVYGTAQTEDRFYICVGNETPITFTNSDGRVMCGTISVSKI